MWVSPPPAPAPRASPGSGVPRSSSRFPARLSSRSPELLCPASAWASRRTKSLGTRPHPRCEALSLDSPLLPRSLVSPIQTPRFPSPSPVPPTPSGHRSPAPAPPGGMTDSSCAESVLRPQGSENQSRGRELSGLPTGPPTPLPALPYASHQLHVHAGEAPEPEVVGQGSHTQGQVPGRKKGQEQSSGSPSQILGPVALLSMEKLRPGMWLMQSSSPHSPGGTLTDFPDG